MAADVMIDFRSASTETLLNPRLPRVERSRLQEIRDAAPPLEGHVWLTTSGSSGPLKLVALAKEAVLASAAAVNRHLDATPRDVWCCTLPTFHVGGLGVWARAELIGGRVVTLDRWSAADFVETASHEGVTLSSLVPAQVSDLVSLNRPAPPSLRAIVIGGAALPEEIRSRAVSLGWPLLPSFGMTECCSQIATAALDDARSEQEPRLRLLDHLEGRTLDGRLAIRGTSLLTGYAWMEDGVGRFVDPKRDGWFVSEDVALIEREGGATFIRPEGRSADFLKIGGESTSLGRLDDILARILRDHPGHDAALIAVSDSRRGKVIHLVVDDPSVAEEIRSRFDAEVLPFERSRQLHVAAIPRSPLGKLSRDELVRAL
ncbi:MAG TPA: AMP-binding protein, partial [Thermoanaerobaculia bacterium]|nr:AMP-binding protein [Thermoanaerobaculia bacterium]